MKIYLECNMGAAGDMLMAALLELLPDRNAFLQKMNGLGIPGVEIELVPMSKCSILGSHICVRVCGRKETVEDVSVIDDRGADQENQEPFGDRPHDENAQKHEHKHMGLPEIRELINNLSLPDEVKVHALEVYRTIAEAESQVHAVPVEQIHFHEVGSMDAVADVVGCCLLVHMLDVQDISASPVHVGSGFVRAAHGILPVPAPATAIILKGVPIYGGKIKGELCTPTGAALLRHFVRRFGEMEPMSVVKIGYGMGTKDFEAANCVRAFLGAGLDEQITTNCNLGGSEAPQ